jgi:hypothetical protein
LHQFWDIFLFGSLLDHFQWANGGTHIIGITAIGRGTVLALRLNNEDVVQARAIWIGLSWHPPND